MADKGSGDTSPKPKPALVRLGQQNGRVNASPGLPQNRMNTFKAPRDLTLGAPKIAERKKFVPNLNVTRAVKKEGEDNEGSGKKGNNRRHGKKHQDKKERKERPGLIQTMGSIFAEGVGGNSNQGIRRRSGISSFSREHRDGAHGDGLVKPKLELDSKYTKEEEEARLKELLRDDFIDDLSSGGFVPVQLPMVDTGKIFKEEIKVEIDESEDNIKPSNLRRQPAELDSDDEDDPKPEVKPKIQPTPVAPEVSIADLIKTQKGDLLFIQLPDNLPGQVIKQEGGDGGCNLGSLDEGCLGKLQIRKSGACQLILGDNQVFDVEVGTRAGFLQDAVSFRKPGQGEDLGDLTVLGHVRHRLVVTPNWNSLLSKAGLSPSLA